MNLKCFITIKNIETGEIEDFPNYKEFKAKYKISSDAASIAYKCNVPINNLQILYKNIPISESTIAFECPICDRFGRNYNNMYELCNKLNTDRIYYLLKAINEKRRFMGHCYSFVVEPDYSVLEHKYKLNYKSKMRILLNKSTNEIYYNALDAANKMRVSVNSIYRSISTKRYQPIHNLVVLNVDVDSKYFLKEKFIEGYKIYYISDKDPSKYTLTRKDFNCENPDNNKTLLKKIKDEEKKQESIVKEIPDKIDVKCNLPLEHLADFFNIEEDDLIDEALKIVPQDLMDIKSEIIDINFSKEAFDILYQSFIGE